MNCLRETRTARSQESEYAKVEVFRKVFTAEMDSLYLLALLLTADDVKAETCFVAGVEDSVNSNSVFRDWARSWAKRTIIKNAIAAIRPGPGKPNSASEASLLKNRLAGGLAEVGGVLALDDFERFVFVLSVLERYSEKECSLLLDCSIAEVQSARIAALEHLAAKGLPLMGPEHGPKAGQMKYAIR